MKTIKTSLSLLALFLLCGCLSQEFLPRPREIATNPFGSYIRISTLDRKTIMGELIAVGRESLYVRNTRVEEVVEIAMPEITHYTLIVADTDHNAWIPFLYPSISAAHGVYMIFTLPLNIATSASAAQGGYTIKSKNIKMDQLHKFARFPQGLPPGMQLSDIR